MNLRDIFNKILDIASKIEYNTLSYRDKPFVMTRKKPNPANRLTAIVAQFTADITNDITPSKQKIESALADFKKIAKDYGIEQLRKPIEDLSNFLNNL